jgi:hypothetical protein
VIALLKTLKPRAISWGFLLATDILQRKCLLTTQSGHEQIWSAAALARFAIRPDEDLGDNFDVAQVPLTDKPLVRTRFSVQPPTHFKLVIWRIFSRGL